MTCVYLWTIYMWPYRWSTDEGGGGSIQYGGGGALYSVGAQYSVGGGGALYSMGV